MKFNISNNEHRNCIIDYCERMRELTWLRLYTDQPLLDGLVLDDEVGGENGFRYLSKRHKKTTTQFKNIRRLKMDEHTLLYNNIHTSHINNEYTNGGFDGVGIVVYLIPHKNHRDFEYFLYLDGDDINSLKSFFHKHDTMAKRLMNSGKTLSESLTITQDYFAL